MGPELDWVAEDGFDASVRFTEATKVAQASDLGPDLDVVAARWAAEEGAPVQELAAEGAIGLLEKRWFLPGSTERRVKFKNK